MDKRPFDQYLDNLLAYISVDEPSNPDNTSRHDLLSLIASDPVCSAFRLWTIDLAYPKLEEDDVALLKQVLLTAWKTGQFPVKQGDNIGITAFNPSSQQAVLQVIIAVLFCRQLVKPLSYALFLAPPPRETIFDVMDLDRMVGEYRSVKIWDLVLRSGWIHDPGSKERLSAWISIFRSAMSPKSISTPEELSSFLCFLRDSSIGPNIEDIHRLLAYEAVEPARLALFCTIFPARKLLPAHSPGPQYSSPNTLLRAAAMSDLPQQEKCAFLTILLQQGLDPNWMHPPAPSDLRGAMDLRRAADNWYERRESETALHVAAGRGDVDVVRLLLRSGARASVKDGVGMRAEDRVVSSRNPEEVREALRVASSKGRWFRFWEWL